VLIKNKAKDFNESRSKDKDEGSDNEDTSSE